MKHWKTLFRFLVGIATAVVGVPMVLGGVLGEWQNPLCSIAKILGGIICVICSWKLLVAK